MGRLSTHVLDTAHGCPARGVALELQRQINGVWHPVKSTLTNADGRTDTPLMVGEDFALGTYQIVFHVGDYFRAFGTALAAMPFLDIVPLQFSLSEPDGHYHVPLLVSPWSYSTYRGS